MAQAKMQISSLILDQNLDQSDLDKRATRKVLVIASGMGSHTWDFIANSDGHARTTLRIMVTEPLKGNWEELRESIQASVALKAITGHAAYAGLNHDFAVGIATLPQVQFETTLHRFYADIDMLTSLPNRDGKAFVEFAYNFAFFARALN